MKRFYKYAVHCILTFVFVFASVEVFAQGIVGTTSANGVNIIFQDGFKTAVLGAGTDNPKDLTKWYKRDSSGTTTVTINATAANSYNTKAPLNDDKSLSVASLGTSSKIWLWSPEIQFPNDSVIIRFTVKGQNQSSSQGSFILGFGFDASTSNNLIPDNTPLKREYTINATAPGIQAANWWTAFYPFRHIVIDAGNLQGKKGRLGIYLEHKNTFGNANYFIDWVMVGTKPKNDLIKSAIRLEEGDNGVFYSSTARGLIPYSSAHLANNKEMGGSVCYIPSNPPTTGSITDGHEPNDKLGPLNNGNKVVENSTWYFFDTPKQSDCQAGTLKVKLTVKNTSCINVFDTQELQWNLYDKTSITTPNLLPTTNVASTVGLIKASGGTPIWGNPISEVGWVQTQTFTVDFDKRYYLLIDHIRGNDCRFEFNVETLINDLTMDGCTVLPITLKSFNATPEEDGTVNITWATLSERNNDFFTLERSMDGVNYVEIQKQAGSGNSTTEQVYGSVDFLPEAGLNYYRLKQTDFDGNFEYFDPVAVNVIPSMLNMTLIPNPTSRDASVLLSSRSRQHIQLQVYDITGKFLFQVEDYINEGNTSFSLPSEKWNSGTYLVRVVTDKETITEKLIVNL